MRRTKLYFEDGFQTIIEHEKPYVPYQEELIAAHGHIIDFKLLPVEEVNYDYPVARISRSKEHGIM